LHYKLFKNFNQKKEFAEKTVGKIAMNTKINYQTSFWKLLRFSNADLSIKRSRSLLSKKLNNLFKKHTHTRQCKGFFKIHNVSLNSSVDKSSRRDEGNISRNLSINNLEFGMKTPIRENKRSFNSNLRNAHTPAK